MIAVTFGHSSSNFGDQAITLGTVASLRAASEVETVVVRVGQDAPTVTVAES